MSDAETEPEADAPKADKPKPRKKPKKKAPRGLEAFTERGSVPWWITAARVVLILAFAATIPFVLGAERGRQLFWAGAIAILPLFWVLGGYHLWRRICPLAVFAQLGRYFGAAGSRKAPDWLAANYPLVQLGIMLTALSLRLTMTNGTPMALAVFLGTATLIAIAIGFVFTGKTWCNYVCPVGLVEKIYNEPSRLAGPDTSQCAPCTACKKNCPDIDLEQGYWKEMDEGARRIAYFAWPGIVFGFYFYYYLVAGSWDFYFGGEWTRQNDQIQLLLEPGFTFLESIPIVVAAPLTLLVCGAASYTMFSIGHSVALRSAESDEDKKLVRHRSLVLAGFIAFIIFYFYGGQPTIRMAPRWVATLFSVVVVIAATAIFLSRWHRKEEDFVQERFAKKILKRWQWGDEPPSDRLQDIYLVHNERSNERKARIQAYKETVREMVADGIVTQSEMAILDGLRGQLGISEREHETVLAELSEEERQLFDPDYQGSVEQRVQKQAYQRDLEQVVVAAARAGTPPTEAELGAVRKQYNVDRAGHDEALAEILSVDGPIAELFSDQVNEIVRLAEASGWQRSEKQDSTSVAFWGYLCRWRAQQRAQRALNLLAPIAGEMIDDLLGDRLLSDRDPVRERARVDVAEFAPEALYRSLFAALDRILSAEETTSLEPLWHLAEDASSQLRATAVHLLSRLDDERSKKAVLDGSEDPEPLVREAAFHALGVRGRLGRDQMERALQDEDRNVREAAVQAVAGRRAGRTTTETALAKAAAAKTSGLFATFDADAHLAALTTLEKMMLLRGVPLFQQLEPSDLEEATNLAEERRFDAGEVLCREGEDGDEIFLVVFGEAVAWKGTPENKTILGKTGAGGCIGEMAVLDASVRSATVETTRPTRTLVLDGDDFRALMLARPVMGQSIIEVLVGRIRNLIDAK